MPAGPGGQDSTCRPVTNGQIHFELGLRNYVKTSKFKANNEWKSQIKLDIIDHKEV